MAVKSGSLVQPLSIDKHSPAELVTENPTYTVVSVPSDPIYEVISPVGNNVNA